MLTHEGGHEEIVWKFDQQFLFCRHVLIRGQGADGQSVLLVCSALRVPKVVAGGKRWRAKFTGLKHISFSDGGVRQLGALIDAKTKWFLRA